MSGRGQTSLQAEAADPMNGARCQYDAIVIGLGRTGLAALRYLQSAGRRVAAADTRSDPPSIDTVRQELPGIHIRTGRLDAAWLTTARCLVVSPGVPVREPAIQEARVAGVEVLGDIELFARVVDAPVIAITGSNGKSTVTRLVELMGRECGIEIAAGGNIGMPVLELLDGPPRQAYVLELSSFQLETTESLRPAAAAVLNVSPDHMDRYVSFDDYRAAKARIYAGARAVVCNRGDPATRPPGTGAGVWTFGLDAPAGERDFGLVVDGAATWLASGRGRLVEARRLALAGRHNQANVLAALALGAAAGWDPAPCVAAAQRFTGLPHRMEPVAERAGVRWINDSKATNVGAAAAALGGAGAPAVLIAGGDGKGADFQPLRHAVAATARAVVLLGRDAPLIERALGDAVPVHRAVDLDDAVRQAAELARAGDVVLLSPACASFDMFPDYEHRGDAFRAAVARLP